MSQAQTTIYQSNLVVFDEVKNMLHSACKEEWSGVFLIVADNGDGAGFSLDHGKIVDAGYKSVRGNEALPGIKNIERARFFFEQRTSNLPCCTPRAERDMPDTAHILSFLGICDMEKRAVVEQPSSIRKVMVVDDSRMVRAVVKKILAKANYEIIEAVDGESAIPAIEQEQPDLVLLDMIMPDLDGKETFLRLKDISPSVKILLASGYSKNSKAAGILKNGVQGFIQKPYRMQELSKIINDTLKK